MSKKYHYKWKRFRKYDQKTSNACKKRSYPTKRDARRVRDIQQAETGTKLFIYECDVCNMYHLTHQSWGKNKRIT